MGERARGGIKVISKTYNVDCLEYMKTLPDNAFDLAVVDPPYGDGCSQSVQVERERERRTAYNRFGGWFDRYKAQVEQAEPGRQSTVKKS